MLSHDKTSQALAIGLAMLAGFIDSLGFMSLGGVFTSFMSGNSTRFAVGLNDHANWGVALIPLVVIIIFVAGVMLGRIIRHYRPRKPSTAIMIFMSLALLIAEIVQEWDIIGAAIFFMVIAMGAANNIFIKNGEVSIPVTYVTGTLVRLGQRMAGSMLGEENSTWLPYLLLWSGLLMGAFLGAISYHFWELHSLWVGIAACAALTVFCNQMEMTDTAAL